MDFSSLRKTALRSRASAGSVSLIDSVVSWTEFESVMLYSTMRRSLL